MSLTKINPQSRDIFCTEKIVLEDYILGLLYERNEDTFFYTKKVAQGTEEKEVAQGTEQIFSYTKKILRGVRRLFSVGKIRWEIFI